MSQGVVAAEGAQYSGSLIPARLGMGIGPEVYGVSGNVIVDVSFARNRGASNGPSRVRPGKTGSRNCQRKYERSCLLSKPPPARGAHPCLRAPRIPEKKIFNLLSTDESIHVDERVEKTEWSSPEVLAAPCEMEMKGIVKDLPGKQFHKIPM
jgi:DNA processing protein